MKTFFVLHCRMAFIAIFLTSLLPFVQAQNSSKSLVINHGGDACGSDAPKQHFFSGTVTSNPTLIASCDVGIPYYDVLAAYNPADQKVYFAQKAGSVTNVYALDFNFSGAITCPSASSPTYTYSYMLDQLCFDNEGNNYVIYNFNTATGTAQIAQVDITTGVQNPGTSKLIRFPAGQIPNSVLFGDIIILPNGRMFMTFGNAPSKLFELTNLHGSGDATAVFLADIPRQCFSIGYADGNLVIAGSDGGGCYYYVWDINSYYLSTASTFPLGKNSSDMSNMTVAVGTSNELMGSVLVNANTSTLYYDVVLKNKGNISLSNVQLTNDLAKTFGAGNVSGVQISFVHNPANLILNANYNGTSDINLLQSGQVLGNSPSSSDSVVIRIQLTAKNLIQQHVYLNSAVGSGQIGSGSNYLAVSDSSNNGRSSKIDIDGNGVSDDYGENVPTPFAFGAVLANNTLTLKGIHATESINLSWNVAAAEKITTYELQRSFDGKQFQTIAIFNNSKLSNNYNDPISSGGSIIYYQLKAKTSNEEIVYSNILSFQKAGNLMHTSVWPNPFQTHINVQFTATENGEANIRILNGTGQYVSQKKLFVLKGKNTVTIESGTLKTGLYLCEIQINNEKQILKIIKD